MAFYSQPHICQCLTRLSTLRGNSVLTIAGNREKTGHQFVEDVLSLAAGLVELGLRSGHIVAICAFNSEWYLEWLLAVAYVGGVVAPLNHRWSFEEAKSAMLSVRPVMLASDGNLELCSSHTVPSLKWHVVLPSFSCDSVGRPPNVLTTEMLRKQSIGSQHLKYTWAPEGAVIICFTSGTTGRPKGVVISHTALIVQSLAKVAIVGYSEDDVYLHTAPLCHIGGLSSAMAMLMVGACHILVPKFEAGLAIEIIERHGVTSLITVPAIMSDLISIIKGKEIWNGSETVRKILNGGGSLSVKLLKDAIKFFPRAKLLSAYGMTESCSSLTFITLYDPRLEIPGQLMQTYSRPKSNSTNQLQGLCVGKPAPHVELKISNDGCSQVGRILTRGPHVMLRYYNQNPSNANCIDEDWFNTGDVGSIDDSGNLRLVGRSNNRIKTGGENVHPEEVEAILLQHPGITAAIVLGIPDTRLTEMVVACIKLRQGWQWLESNCTPVAENELILCSEILQKHCRERNLSRFKLPKKYILWKKPFPLTTTGKIRRDLIRREAMFHLQFLSCNL